MYSYIKLSYYNTLLKSHVVQPKCIQFLFVSHTSIKLGGKKKYLNTNQKKTAGVGPQPPYGNHLAQSSSCLICKHRCNTHICPELPIWKVEPTAAQLLCKAAQRCGLRVRAGVGAMKRVKAECLLSYTMFTMDRSFSESRKAWMGSGSGGTGGRQRCCPKQT